MESGSLKYRFLLATKRLDLLLKLVGIDWDCNFRSSWQKWLMNGWSLCWLAFNAESCIYMFATNGIKHIFHIFTPMEDTSQIFSFSALISHTNPMLFGIAPHAILLCTLRKTSQLLWENLDIVDRHLNKPDLHLIERYSIGGIIWILAAAIFHGGFIVCWEMFHPYRKFAGWRRVLQNFACTFNFNMFTFISTWIFVVFGQLIIVHLNKLAENLKSMTEIKSAEDQCFRQVVQTLGHIQHLNQAACILKRRFKTILTAVFCASFISMVNLSYFLVQFAIKKHIVWPVWDFLQVLENLMRIFFVCRTTDHVHLSVLKCIPFLRKLRNSLHSQSVPGERLKITLIIIEITRNTKTNYFKLLDVLPVSKKLILKSIKTLVEYLIIVYQMKMTESAWI